MGQQLPMGCDERGNGGVAVTTKTGAAHIADLISALCRVEEMVTYLISCGEELKALEQAAQAMRIRRAICRMRGRRDTIAGVAPSSPEHAPTPTRGTPVPVSAGRYRFVSEEMTR